MAMRTKIGDMVYLKTGDDLNAKFVTAICRRQGGTQYELTSGKESSWHNNFEFSHDKPKGIKITGLRNE